MTKLSFAILILALQRLELYGYHQPGQLHEVCHHENFVASCPPGMVIMIDSAVFGRMRAGRCIRLNKEVLGCQLQVPFYVQGLCAGRQQCNISANLGLIFPHGCDNELNGYLAVEYHCLSEVYDTTSRCERNRPIEVTTDSGYLSSDVTIRTGRGSPQCPWLIKGLSDGSTLNVTLLDFSQPSTVSDETICTVYAKMQTDASLNTPFCGSQAGQQQIYSGKEDLRVIIVNKTANPFYFLLYFQVNRAAPAVCSSYKPPTSSLVAIPIDGKTVTVRCNNDYDGKEAWNLTCRNGEWQASTGRVINDCTDMRRDTLPIPGGQNEPLNDNSFVMKMLIMSVMILFVVLITTIAFVVYYVKRNKPGVSAAINPSDPYAYGQFNSGMMPQDGPVLLDYQSHSQNDLLNCSSNAHLSPRNQRHPSYRDYRTMLEMRRIGAPNAAGLQGRPGWPQQYQNAMLPDVWTTADCSTCPLHGQGHGPPHNSGPWTISRNRWPVHHIYDLPAGAEYDPDDANCCATHNPNRLPMVPEQTSTNTRFAGSERWNYPIVHNDGPPMSPFYNELEAFADIGSNAHVLPTEDQSSMTCQGETLPAASTNDRIAPPIPLTRL